jgi:hypothetical protein
VIFLLGLRFSGFWLLTVLYGRFAQRSLKPAQHLDSTYLIPHVRMTRIEELGLGGVVEALDLLNCRWIFDFKRGQMYESSNAHIRLLVSAHGKTCLSNKSSKFVLLRVSYLSMQSNPVPNHCSYQSTNFPTPFVPRSYCCASPLLFRFFFSFFGAGPFSSAWKVS